MDSETSDLRASRLGSRLPAPRAIPEPTSSVTAGLTELSDSQHNARSQIAMPPPLNKGLKRDLPQPAQTSEAKRKPLSQRALEYPPKPTATAPSIPRPNVQGISLVGVSSGLKQPGRYASTRPPSAHNRQNSATNFATGVGPDSRGSYSRPKTSHSNHSRSVSSKSKGSDARPQTSYGHRAEDESEPTENAWDVDGRLGNIEQQFDQLKSIIGDAASDREALGNAVEMYKSRVSELQNERDDLLRRAGELNSDTNRYRDEVSELRRTLDEAEWRSKNEIEALQRANEHARDDFQRSIDAEVDRLNKGHQEELEAVKRHYAAELEDERRDKARQIDEMRRQMGDQQQDMHGNLQKKNTEVSDLRSQIESLKGDLDREATLKSTLQTSLAEMSAANITMEAKMNSLRSQIEFLESDSKAQSDSFADMEARLQEAHRIADEAKQKLIKEETERRVLFNKYQELKGNIRVMCRVRPVLDSTEGSEANIGFPDEKTSAKIGVLGPEEKSSLGNITRKEYPFEFDRVFTPSIGNEEIFGEISQLVQSALDGYNVCIFCYGQTGSGKTFTMSSGDGMIPRATHMIYETITQLQEKSWTYTMEGSFIEVYNEELHDLLTPNGREAPKKLDIRHDDARKQTTVVNCKTVQLDSPDEVEAMLAEAQNNRTVAATKANERSSRSHSVFILKLVGENSATGERCEGTLNLVDLAGSERLKHSQVEGDRMKETQNINKSLSCLGDVIDALGRGTAHVPYRNSKLTHLLQYSLGGNSKTLMFVMVSPLEAHLKETLTSLRFAAKVHNTHIGTAKATKKIRDS